MLSDIHANLPALESCLACVDKLHPDAIYCLGDLVGYNVWPNEVIAEIRKRRIPTIAGNYDQGIGMHSDECGCAYKTEEEKAMGKISIAYTNEKIGEDERKYLRMLPAHIRITFQSGKETFNMLFVHGSPRRINEYLFADRSDESFLRIMRDADADIMCFGHTHKQFQRVLVDPETNRVRLAINTGSVGKPKHGNPSGNFVMLDTDLQPPYDERLPVKVTYHGFGYDVERAARAIEESPLPDAYADMLRRGV